MEYPKKRLPEFWIKSFVNIVVVICWMSNAFTRNATLVGVGFVIEAMGDAVMFLRPALVSVFEVIFNSVMILGPALIPWLYCSKRFGKGPWKPMSRARYIDWIQFTHEKLTSQRAFWLAFIVPLLYFIAFSLPLYLGAGDIQFNADAYSNFLEDYKLPLGMLSSSLLLVVLVARAHGTAQTEHQIDKAEQQISMAQDKQKTDDYLAHRESIAKALEGFSATDIYQHEFYIKNACFFVFGILPVSNKSYSVDCYKHTMFSYHVDKLCENMSMLNNVLQSDELDAEGVLSTVSRLNYDLELLGVGDRSSNGNIRTVGCENQPGDVFIPEYFFKMNYLLECFHFCAEFLFFIGHELQGYGAELSECEQLLENEISKLSEDNAANEKYDRIMSKMFVRVVRE